MEDLRHHAAFAATASAGSMTAAAGRLGMTPSAVSQLIRALEARSGVTLLHRSTRRLSLTEAGERCLPHCRRLVEAGQAAAASLEHARDAPVGELRIATPIGFAAHVSPALAPVLAEWPSLRLRLIVDDRLIDLVEARIDVALRVGNLPDTRWIGRKLCDFDRLLCASPAYLERRGAPGTPAELPAHDWLATSAGSQAGATAHGEADGQAASLALELHGAGVSSNTVFMPVRIATTSQVALQQLCQEGMGIAVLFYPDVRPALERGALVRVLPGWRPPSAAVTMVTPTIDREAAKARVAVEALRRYFSELPTIG